MVVKDRIKRFFQQAASIVRGNAELTIFFFFLTTSLFLGDGKQPLVDAWWALGILMMYGARYYQRGRLDLRPLPRPVGLAWMALILCYFIRTSFSDSVGYSITATIRLTEAYLVFIYFYSVSSEKIIEVFAKGVIIFGTIATFASFVFLLYPSLADFLPPMNLLYATYGHNHLADLLLLVFPVVIGFVREKRNQVSANAWRSAGILGLLALFTIGMLLTFARGAWILFVFYLLFLIVCSRHLAVRRIGLSVAAATIVAFLALSLVSVRGVPRNDGLVSRVTRQFQKQSLPEDGRLEYWRQAIEAIKERPFFGGGPGTFYLQSKRLQARSSSYSWFAHSLLLQNLVELGVTGTIFLVVLLFFIARYAWDAEKKHEHSPDYQGLAIGAGLTLVYSFYEFNLDYVVVWLLWWATLGGLVGTNKNTDNYFRVPLEIYTMMTCLIYLGLYYATYIVSLVVSTPGSLYAIMTAPYRVDTAVGINTNSTIRYLHQRDPEVMFAIGQALSRGGKIPEALTYYRDASGYDPLNEKYFGQYVQSLVANGRLDAVGILIKQWSKMHAPAKIQADLVRLDFSSQELVLAYKSVFSDGVFQRPQKAEDLSKLYYLLGLSIIQDNSQRTKQLWMLARDASVEWGYYHAELASLLLYEFHDESAAKKALVDCEQYRHPKELCTITLQHWDEVPKPGSYEQQIRNIPKLSE